MSNPVIYIMGVSGSGKTTIGKILSEKTGYTFYDADDFHSQDNKAKMNIGLPLTDEDREPWLDNIHHFVVEAIKKNPVILVCSALKQRYRERLSDSVEDNCRWIFLEGDFNTIFARLNNRAGHFMPASLLQSQFDALEIPQDAIRIDIHMSPEEIAETIISNLKR
jgi:6-phosphogluconate dehydrogenase